MPEAVMESALHAFQLPDRVSPMDGTRGVWMNEVPHLGFINIRGNIADSSFVTASSRALGLPLPTSPCTFAAKDGLKVLWVSPDEWMVVLPRKDHAGLLSGLVTALKDVRSQVVDNSGGYTQLVLLGRHAGDVLGHTSIYDVAALGEGRVVGTTLGKSSVYLHRVSEGYCLIMRRSFAGYIWQYLVRAAGQYDVGIGSIEKTGAGHPP